MAAWVKEVAEMERRQRANIRSQKRGNSVKLAKSNLFNLLSLSLFYPFYVSHKISCHLGGIRFLDRQIFSCAARVDYSRGVSDLGFGFKQSLAVGDQFANDQNLLPWP